MDAVRIMGGDTLLMVPGKWDAAQRYDEFWDHALETAKRIAEVAAQKQITVALENVENRFLLSPGEWALFLDQVASPWVRMYFDAGNIVINCQGYPHQWIAQLGEQYIHRVHFKGGREGGPSTYLLEGDVDWAAVMTALRDMNYTDWIGVELSLPAHYPAAMLAGTCATARGMLDPNKKPQQAPAAKA